MNVHAIDPMFAARRPIVMSEKGIVSAGHHQAAQAGAHILKSGGNAMDAAVAAAAALAIAIPQQNGIGGDAIGLWADSSGAVTAINGSGIVPAQVSAEKLRAGGLSSMPRRGPATVTVPGVVAAWGEALERFGTMPLSDVLAPAVELAREGVPLDATMVGFLNGPLYAELVDGFPLLGEMFGSPGARSIGERLKQSAAASTLAALSQQGWRSFYQGTLASSWLAEARAAGVMIEEQDLQNHRTTFAPSLSLLWRESRIHVAPPNSQGLALLAMMGLSDHQPFPPSDTDTDPIIDPVAYLSHKVAAFRMRDRYCVDPKRLALPADILSPESLKAISLTSAQDGVFVPTGDTSTLVVVDRDGNAVSWVQSLFESFGSGIACRDHGIVLHNRAMLERLNDDPVRGLQGGFRPFHTLCPAIVTNGKGVEMTLATPGDHGQPQSLYQVLRRHFEQGLDIQTAIEWPRVRHDDGPEVMLEMRCPGSWDQLLIEAGWKPQRVDDFSRIMGSVTAIRRMPDGLLMGGADARRSSYAIGV